MNVRALILGLIIIALIPAGVVSAAPEERLGHRMIYDPVDKRIILYGGSGLGYDGIGNEPRSLLDA